MVKKNKQRRVNNKKKKKGKKTVSASGKPFVSICTPTYNRRMFIPNLIKCFQAQTYPKELMEWITVKIFKEIVHLFSTTREAAYQNHQNP